MLNFQFAEGSECAKVLSNDLSIRCRYCCCCCCCCSTLTVHTNVDFCAATAKSRLGKSVIHKTMGLTFDPLPGTSATSHGFWQVSSSVLARSYSRFGGAVDSMRRLLCKPDVGGCDMPLLLIPMKSWRRRLIWVSDWTAGSQNVHKLFNHPPNWQRSPVRHGEDFLCARGRFAYALHVGSA